MGQGIVQLAGDPQPLLHRPRPGCFLPGPLRLLGPLLDLADVQLPHMLGAGTAIFGVFFFITLFAQQVWGYSALRTGASFLPLTVTLVAASIAAGALVQRVGVRTLVVVGAVAAAGGMYWLSRISEHGSYVGGLLGPSLVMGVGLGLMFVPLPLVAMTGVPEADSGAAASLLNVGRQVGGALGLAILGTVAWTVVANSARAQAAAAVARGLACDLARLGGRPGAGGDSRARARASRRGADPASGCRLCAADVRRDSRLAGRPLRQ